MDSIFISPTHIYGTVRIKEDSAELLYNINVCETVQN